MLQKSSDRILTEVYTVKECRQERPRLLDTQIPEMVFHCIS